MAQPQLIPLLQTTRALYLDQIYIKTIHQIIVNQSLAPLSLPSSKCNIPEIYLFRYFQFSHAFSSQFSHSAPQVIQSTLEEVLRFECEANPTFLIYIVIWCYYPYLSRRVSGPDGNVTFQILMMITRMTSGTFPFHSLVSLCDRLIQFKLICHILPPTGCTKWISALPLSTGGAQHKSYKYIKVQIAVIMCLIPIVHVFWARTYIYTYTVHAQKTYFHKTYFL